jgi:hypothetical protein
VPRPCPPVLRVVGTPTDFGPLGLTDDGRNFCVSWTLTGIGSCDLNLTGKGVSLVGFPFNDLANVGGSCCVTLGGGRHSSTSVWV